ncbi:MAG: hypothetical protein KGL51_00755 [Betaproteobacteria bacterium]|nr:hypothetical protein [Betaproteobacteria bacterium]
MFEHIRSGWVMPNQAPSPTNFSASLRRAGGRGWTLGITKLRGILMGWFGKKKVPYQGVVIEALNKALAIRLKAEKAFEKCSVNNLEAVIAMFWIVERSLQGLPRPKLEKTGSHLMEELLAWLSDDYSHDEISRLVIPAFDKRLNEYSGLFVIRAGEEPQAPLLRTFKQIVENVFGEDEAPIAQIVAALLMWWQPISEEGARITALDKMGEIAW